MRGPFLVATSANQSLGGRDHVGIRDTLEQWIAPLEFVGDASADPETSRRQLAMRITAVQVPTPERFAIVKW
jgi:hypothetical protein